MGTREDCRAGHCTPDNQGYCWWCGADVNPEWREPGAGHGSLTVVTVWVKFRGAAKRRVARAAKVAGYAVETSGKDSGGRFVYGLAVAASNSNEATLRALLTREGACDASWL